MHLAACSALLVRHHNNPHIQDLLSRLNKDKLVGTISYSDPGTGGHFWFPLSSKVRQVEEDKYRLLKYGSWTTSAGFADFYVIQANTTKETGTYGSMSNFLVYKDEIRAHAGDWQSLGMRGNHSGPLVCDVVLDKERIVGSLGDGCFSNTEGPGALCNFAYCTVWNGISLGAIDLAKKHVTRKAHADVGLRVCDYETIQSYFGDVISQTNSSRALIHGIAVQMDRATNGCDWSMYATEGCAPRGNFGAWLMQAKLVSSKNVAEVTDLMLYACGGAGYKAELGIERLLRDGRAGWLMAPSVEVMKVFIGKMALMGPESLDLWEQHVNHRILGHELEKMNADDKEKLAKQLMEEVKKSREKTDAPSYQDEDFDNPFNTQPIFIPSKDDDATEAERNGAALDPVVYKELKLTKKEDLTSNFTLFVFSFPNSTDLLNCLPGQYIQVRIPAYNGHPPQERYFSPVSSPDEQGCVQLVLKYESAGILSNFCQNMKIGDTVEFRGPMGGFEYKPSSVAKLILICSGGGITPGRQIIRSVASNPDDSTKVTLFYYADDLQDLLFREELDGYQQTDSRFKMVYSLGDCPEEWPGEEGYLDKGILSKHVTSNGKKTKVVICGGPTMVLSILYALKDLGFVSDDLFVFGPMGAEQVRKVYGRNAKLSSHRSDQ